MQKFAFTAEQGARHVVYAAVALQDQEEQMRGAYMTCSEIREPSDYVLSPDGQKAQAAIWVSFFSSSSAKDFRFCTAA
jgi:hypothetical protein